ncbi:MAG: ABC transporter permease [Lachnospiraceae bacterium]|nr:ABC transporter permease [Lachnospiraceae bacterium]
MKTKVNEGLVKLFRSGILTWVLFVFLWWFLSLFYEDILLPGPLKTAKGSLEIILNGKLFKFALISMRRVYIGWAVGCLVGIPLGILIGRIELIRGFFEPCINFFRFVPGLALITLFLMWFGVDEGSKIMIILYGTVFTVSVNVIAGILAMDQNRIYAARILGVNERQILYSVIWPQVIPYAFTGARLGLGGAFGAIVAAEMVAATEGVGYLIYNSRLYFRTDWIIAGVITLGLMGFFSDKLFRMLGNRYLRRFGVREKTGF